MRLLSFTAVGLFCLSSLSFADNFEYRINHFAANQRGTACDTDVQMVSETLAEFTGINVSAAFCEVNRISGDSLDGVVRYQASEPVEIARYAQYGNIGIEDTALYANMESCQEDIERQVGLFIAQTGLRPHAAFCNDQTFGDHGRANLQMEAAGIPDRQHFFTGVSVYKAPAESYDALKQQVDAQLAEHGIAVSLSGYSAAGVGLRMTFGYYADSRKKLYGDNKVRIDDADECAAYLARAHTALDDLENPPVGMYCNHGPAGYSGIYLNIISVGEHSTEPNGYMQEEAPGYYESVLGCRADRVSQIEHAQQIGKDVLEAFCGFNRDRKVVLQLYYKS